MLTGNVCSLTGGDLSTGVDDSASKQHHGVNDDVRRHAGHQLGRYITEPRLTTSSLQLTRRARVAPITRYPLATFPLVLCHHRHIRDPHPPDLRLNGREFDPRPPHYRSVGTGMGDRLRANIPHRHVTSHPSQLSNLPSVRREMSTGQSAVMLCGWQ